MRNEFIIPIGLMVVWVVSESHGSLGTDQSQKTQGFVTLSHPADFVTLSQSAENRREGVTDSGYAYLTHFERSNISLKETKPDGVDSNSNGLDCCLRNNERKIQWFSAV